MGKGSDRAFLLGGAARSGRRERGHCGHRRKDLEGRAGSFCSRLLALGEDGAWQGLGKFSVSSSASHTVVTG